MWIRRFFKKFDVLVDLSITKFFKRLFFFVLFVFFFKAIFAKGRRYNVSYGIVAVLFPL